MRTSIGSLCACICALVPAAQADQLPKLEIAYNEDGSVDRPLNYREWVNVGTTLLPKGQVNIIDNKPIENSEYIDTYVEPHSFAMYIATGVWPDGTRIVKEFTATKPSAPDEAVVESHYNGLGMILKDTSRFEEETGFLGYFQFGHRPEPYERRAVPMPRETCSSCHEALASDQQYIFADHHIGLER
ncbi:hypothetical protein NBRC116590_17280 [Pelagimonas sp. KU-00592-HH]|uniref:cytochrome P460 family protein n=1 Tax=Pelagimonas sp. KU-00592-HH TaxID=3127651 RepID=UPI0031035A23